MLGYFENYFSCVYLISRMNDLIEVISKVYRHAPCSVSNQLELDFPSPFQIPVPISIPILHPRSNPNSIAFPLFGGRVNIFGYPPVISRCPLRQNPDANQRTSVGLGFGTGTDGNTGNSFSGCRIMSMPIYYFDCEFFLAIQ